MYAPVFMFRMFGDSELWFYVALWWASGLFCLWAGIRLWRDGARVQGALRWTLTCWNLLPPVLMLADALVFVVGIE